MFDKALRAGLAGLLLVLAAAGIAACDMRATIRSAALATEAWSDSGKVLAWPLSREPLDRQAATQAERSAGAPRAGAL
ncbi:hypothetical protein [Variovorax guangxiensis]|uniref:hypothetical protein n=1 Tax=Variovorax guangxiensis TaxID=1775474 RepID=UPI0028663F85|nr:hypothetical protein [Variovorax guangxiensis]MDR6859424.1 hypothetical protein [Variovorax guangxiensis]